jgi:predicted O-linked N-acetylglucosamine transferase (SPINDLY family)
VSEPSRDPAKAHSLNLLGVAASQRGHHEEALALFTEAAALHPADPGLLYNRGLALKKLGRFAEAIADYDRALRLQPDHAEAHANRGLALHELGEWEAALQAYERALALKPGFAAERFNLANTRHALGDLRGAIDDYERALEISPRLAEAHYNRGLLLLRLGRQADALDSFGAAIASRPDFAAAYFDRGMLLRNAFPQEALADFDRAMQLEPRLDFLAGFRALSRLQLCDWDGIDGELRALGARVQRGERAAPPFALLAMIDFPPLQRRAAEIYIEAKYPPRAATAPPVRRGARKLRVGYFSADFRDHPVAYMTAPIFEAHDRDRFEIVAISSGEPDSSAIRTRMEGAFDRFMDMRAATDDEMTSAARALGLDVAIDLGGHTKDSRVAVFAARVAPVQASYVGYLGTLGASYYDYLLADPVLIPAESRKHYSESVAYLPSYYTYRAEVPEGMPSRDAFGLPVDAFAFCCLGNPYKISPQVFDRWMRILRASPGAVLVLNDAHPVASANLRRRAEAARVDPQRLVAVPGLARDAYLARLRAMDLYLDTHPYNAGTVAADALGRGLPVLTWAGESFASRVCASLLTAAGLPELVARNAGEYEAMAIAFAADPARLGELRRRVEQSRTRARLFDVHAFTRSLEAVYLEMHERGAKAMPPAPIDCLRELSA